MSIGDNINSGKSKNVSGNDIRPDFLDMSCSAADVEHRTINTIFKQLLMEIAIKQSERWLSLPHTAMKNLPLV